MTMIVVLCGNDGTGKSTLCELLREDGHQVIERNNLTDQYQCLEDSVKFMDKLSLSPFAQDYDDAKYTGAHNVDRLLYIILDARVDVLCERIAKRQGAPDHWEHSKALFYYRQKFREMAAYFGFPVVDTSTLTIPQVKEQLVEIITTPGIVEICKQLAGKNMTFESVNKMDVEAMTRTLMEHEDTVTFPDIESPFIPRDANFYDEFKKACYIRDEAEKIVSTVQTPADQVCLQLLTEGESKKVYRPRLNSKSRLAKIPFVRTLLESTVIIILKSTIYSHSKQATGEIQGLGKVRGEGSRLFLEMMHRNGLRHSYRCISPDGIIVSDFVRNVPPTEIVVKKKCEGTDKHSFHGIQRYDCITNDENNGYRNGLYVRFDWRNPNHVTPDGANVSDAIPHYYLLEQILGKEEFFRRYLAVDNPYGIKPLGDRCISQELVRNIILTDETERSAVKIFLTIQHYFSNLDLEVQDSCFMLDADGTVFWSEINQDCMRIKPRSADKTAGYDKDIWRAGGSSKSAQLLEKWTVLNGMLRKYFNDNPFYKTEQLDFVNLAYHKEINSMLASPELQISAKYRRIFKTLLQSDVMGKKKTRRRVIVTTDLFDQRPVLVKSGNVVEQHSPTIQDAMDKISIFPDVLVVDLNGAIQNVRKNAPVIRDLARRYYVHAGGGIRSLKDAQDLLESSVRRIVVSSNLDEAFLKQIPKDRLIVELSVDEKNVVLIKGRLESTQKDIFSYLDFLANLGVAVISITFHHTEGHLQGIPRQQVHDILQRVPRGIKKVIIAGGITTLDDLMFLWHFDRVVPQLGSAIWKNRINIGDLYVAMTNFDDRGLVSAIIQDIHGRVLGNVYLDEAALRKTCEERLLHRFSRVHNCVMKKGQQSGNTQRVVQIAMDCDGDALLVTVDNGDTLHPFCHTGNLSCFSLQTIAKTSLGVLEEHLRERRTAGALSYTARMQENPEFALAKVMEEFWEIVSSHDRTHRLSECSDLIIHFLMYLSGKDIRVSDILNELNARRWNPRIISETPSKKFGGSAEEVLKIAITPAKYAAKTYKFAEEVLGMQIFAPVGRDLRICYCITDQSKYEKFFGNRQVVLVPSRPKDMPWMSACGRIAGAITYNTVIENHPKVFRCAYSVPDDDLRLCLIKRKDESIDLGSFHTGHKLLVATEHVNHVHEYFVSNMVNPDIFSLDRVVGSSEGYMVNDAPGQTGYTLCDAIVESGKTLKENKLEIWRVILDHGQVQIGLFFNALLKL